MVPFPMVIQALLKMTASQQPSAFSLRRLRSVATVVSCVTTRLTVVLDAKPLLRSRGRLIQSKSCPW